jgi:hypothetical protein
MHELHDLLIALAFVAMVACPAIVGALPIVEEDDETGDLSEKA